MLLFRHVHAHIALDGLLQERPYYVRVGMKIDQKLSDPECPTQSQPDCQHRHAMDRHKTLRDIVRDGAQSSTVARRQEEGFHRNSKVSDGRLSNRHACHVRYERPATSPAFVSVDEGIVHDRLCTLHIKAEGHFLDSMQPHRLSDIGLTVRLAVQKQKSPAASSSDLAAQGAVLPRKSVKFIDVGCRDFRRDAPLCLPTFVQQRAYLPEIPLLQCAAHANS